MNFRITACAAACLAMAAAGCRVGVQNNREAAAVKSGNVTETRVAADADLGNDWLLNGRTADERHFSPLRQISDKNISGLGLAWYLDVPGQMGVVAEPIEVDGVLYVSAPLSIVYAVDAATGKVIWKFDPKTRLNQAINGSYSARVNGGVALWNGKVFVGTGDCRLIAIDAAAGTKVWEATVCEPTQTGITHDAETGKEAWRFWTVPGDPAKPFETKALEVAAKTWHGKDSWKIGGADVWNAITYDDATGLVIFGTAGAEWITESLKTSRRRASGCIQDASWR